jgi:hypothetical protein
VTNRPGVATHWKGARTLSPRSESLNAGSLDRARG